FYVTDFTRTTAAGAKDAGDRRDVREMPKLFTAERKGAEMATGRSPLLQSDVPGYPCRHGKVRDVYDLGDRLVIVATDRISAFDWVLPTGIPDKGRVLTALSLFWFDFLREPNHLLSTDVAQMGLAFAERAPELKGRTTLVRKAKVVPIECVVR